MKKVAVFVRGHMRTWDFNKENFFNFCDQLGDQVDYYCAVWKNKKNYPQIDRMKADFASKNLKIFLMPENHWEYDAFKGPAYLSTMLNKFKLEEEVLSGVVYDAVLDTRPDVAFFKTGTVDTPSQWHIGSTRVELEEVNNWRGLEDHVFLSNSPTHTLWTTRSQYELVHYSGHHKLLKYAEINDLTPYVVNFDCRIVRPSIAELGQPVPADLKDRGYTWKFEHAWQAASKAKKLEYMEKANISIDQYVSVLDLGY
jgi:hypothetical protein